MVCAKEMVQHFHLINPTTQDIASCSYNTILRYACAGFPLITLHLVVYIKWKWNFSRYAMDMFCPQDRAMKALYSHHACGDRHAMYVNLQHIHVLLNNISFIKFCQLLLEGSAGYMEFTPISCPK